LREPSRLDAVVISTAARKSGPRAVETRRRGTSLAGSGAILASRCDRQRCGRWQSARISQPMNWTSDWKLKASSRVSGLARRARVAAKLVRRAAPSSACEPVETGQTHAQHPHGRQLQQVEGVSEDFREPGRQIDLDRHIRRRPGIQLVFARMEQMLDGARIGKAIVSRQKFAKRIDQHCSEEQTRSYPCQRTGRTPAACASYWHSPSAIVGFGASGHGSLPPTRDEVTEPRHRNEARTGPVVT
jgi:hypothetical protein